MGLKIWVVKNLNLKETERENEQQKLHDRYLNKLAKKMDVAAEIQIKAFKCWRINTKDLK